MKDIAHHAHTGLRWGLITIFAAAFSLVISSTGLPIFKYIEDTYWATGSTNPFVLIFLGGIGASILWSVLALIFAWLFSFLLRLKVQWRWPRYFFYAFKFSEGMSIVGWMRITLDPSSGILDAVGRSFQADAALDEEKFVTWTSQIVSGGTLQGDATCFILYNLNEFEAREAQRPYRDGLLRFRLLRKTDLKQDAKYPTPSHLGEEQYFGHQQAIDKDGVWNLAYAESVHPDGETNVMVEKALTHDLVVRRESLLAALNILEGSLKNPKV
jgi:hypothetical protein